MGQNQSVKLSKPKRAERDQLKQNTLQQRKVDIDQAQEHFLKKTKNHSVIPVEHISTVVQLTETAKHQLDRGGTTLTKADLIAVILALDPQTRKNYRQLGELTTSDLNVMIRSMIYDPKRFIDTPTQSMTQSTPPQSLVEI
jgi:hypothetical protein